MAGNLLSLTAWPRPNISWPSIRAPRRAGRSSSITMAGSWRRPRRNFPRSCPPRAWSGTIPRPSGRRNWRCPAGDCPGRAVGRRHRRAGRDQPARNHHPLGPPHRPAGGQRHRLAKPRQRAHLRTPQGRRLEPTFRAKTGLLVDAYFSGTKIKYLLDSHEGLRAGPQRGEILFGTVDTWLIWRLDRRPAAHHRLQQRQPHAASSTSTRSIGTTNCSAVLDIPRAMLPEVRPSSEVYGATDAAWFGDPIPIAGDAGDQQAATFGQACFQPGTRQEHLRHRLLPAVEHRRPRPCLGTPTADDHRLGTRRPGDVLSGRLDLHRPARSCSGSATAWALSARRPTWSVWRPACPTRAASISCRPSSAWVRRIGTLTPAARSSD